MIGFMDVYECFGARRFLYDLLKEREPHESISHKAMPTWAQHVDFVDSHPYLSWYVLHHDGIMVGACYVSKQNEVGIAILKEHRGNGYAREALAELLRRHTGRLLANINPNNDASIALFATAGFNGPIQVTLERP